MGDLSEFDELDRRIIEMMCRSSQGSFRQLAKQLGVHPTTLIQRVKNLENKGIIRGYRAKVDYVVMGCDYTGVVAVKADDTCVAGAEIARIRDVVSVLEVTGESNLLVTIACLDREEFSKIVREISAVEGVKRSAASVVLNVFKSSDDFVPELVAGRPMRTNNGERVRTQSIYTKLS